MAGVTHTAGAYLATMAVALLCCIAIASAETDCSAQFNALSPCFEFVNSNDTTSKPSAPCCSAFNTTQVDAPVCLCQLQQTFADPATAPGNVTRANQIPSLCAVAVDPSRCPALLGLAPASAPSTSPSPSPSIAPLAAPPVATTPPATAPVAAGAPAGSQVDCSNEFDSLATCFTYVASNDSSPPDAACCTSLLSVHTHQPVCLCQLLQQANSGDPAMAGLNVTKAIELPAVCKVNADPAVCPALLGQPVASPLGAPAESPLGVVVAGPEAAPAPEAGAPEGGETIAPEASPAGNAGSVLGVPIAGTFVLGFAALALQVVL